MKMCETMIATSFLELLDEKPFNKITVKDIVDRCGINRNTFYYHFDDIPSLMEKILVSRIDSLIDKRFKIGSFVDCVTLTINYFLKNKKSVMHIYKYIPRDNFILHLDRLLGYLVEEYLNNYTAGMNINEQDHRLLVRYFKGMLLGILLGWFEEGMKEDFLDDAIRMCELHEEAGNRLVDSAQIH